MLVLINVLRAIQFSALELPALVAATGSAVARRTAKRRIWHMHRLMAQELNK
jgi:hypothetical protein